MTRRDGLIIFLVFVSAGAYLAISGARGFPLDDAWIHQVYARNLGTRGEFAFFAGQPSAGSTSPLWTILLAFGYALRVDFRVWTYLLGAWLLGASAIITARLAQRLFPSSRFVVYGSLFTIFEWHLAWSAASGMEIPLFIFLMLILVERFHARANFFLVGILAALLTLTRPEGIVLAALIGAGIVAVAESGATHHASRFAFHISRLTLYVFGLAIPLAPYLLFNLTTSGTIFPNTFYAKNIEYASLFQRPFPLLWLDLFAAPWVGAQALLFPGFAFIVVQLARKHEWGTLIPVAWVLVLPALYAARLPVAYQHARYEMPAIPFIAIYGIAGTVALFQHIRQRIIRRAWAISIAAALVVFWLIGAGAYANDVEFIDCEMVQSARWVADNAPADGLVAAHDIGALGYFYDKPFIDLAGLVTPEVIPFLRDEGRLRDYLFTRQATFAIFFPDWYPVLAHDARFMPAYQTNCAVTRAAGSMNMAVYEIVR